MLRLCSSCTSCIDRALTGTARIALGAAIVLFAGAADAERFEVVPATEGSEIIFESKAMMETFQGRTDRVSGYVEFDPLDMGDSVAVFLEVDLATLDTGISLRNRHMRENHLETDRYPVAVFRGGALLEGGGGPLVAGTPRRFLVEGTMELHGVSRSIQVRVDVTLADHPQRLLRIKTEFPITLAEYDIARPKFLFLKLGETQKVTANVVATSSAVGSP